MEVNAHKYQVLVSWIKEQIHTGKIAPGEKFHSEYSLAEMFSISRQTVRQAISILESEGYLEGRRGSGTYVTFSPEVSRKTMNVGVISTYIDDYIFPPIIRGIGKSLSKNGYSMQLVFTLNKTDNETKALENMLERGVDGIIVEPTKSGIPNPNQNIYKHIASLNIPIIFFNAYYQNLPFEHVALDDKAAGKIATQRLIKAGHTKIAAFFKSDDLQGHLRYAGYMEALMENNIPVKAERVLWFATEDIRTLFSDAGRIVSRLNGATAAVSYNDQVAVGLISFLKTQGRTVPDDLSIVSIDNSALAEYCDPPLTSVNHPKEVLGRVVAENLMKKIEDPTFDANLDFEAKLVERSSVAKRNESGL